MSTTKKRLQALIKAGRYNDARALVNKTNHPKKQDILARIDALEHKAQPQVAPLSSQSEDIFQMVAQPLPKQTYSKKPLPLLQEEEQVIFPRGIPKRPNEIIKFRLNRGYRPYKNYGATFFMRALGGHTLLYIRNYISLNKPITAIISAIIYGLLLVGDFIVGPVIGMAHNYSPLSITIALVIFSLPILMPYVLWYLQEPAYKEWRLKYYEIAQAHHEVQAKTTERTQYT